jgi:hypothetical protein
MRYHICFLANGQRACHVLTATSAAAAVDVTQSNVTAGGRAFELLSVQPVIHRPASSDIEVPVPA